MQGLMEGLCCIEGLLRTSKQLCAAIHVRVVGLKRYPEPHDHGGACTEEKTPGEAR